MTNTARIFGLSRLARLLGLMLFVLVGCLHAQTQAPVPLPTPFTPVVDYAHVIDQPTRNHLESLYLDLKQAGNIEFGVLAVDSTGDLDIFDYSLAVARGWGIGAKTGDKAGFLLVVAIKDRKYFTQISDHLEGDLTDGLAGQIQREKLVPAFRQGNYSKGIQDTIDAYVALLSAKRGFTISGVQPHNYTIRQEPRNQGDGFSVAGCCTIIVIIFIIVLIFSSARRGGGGGGCLQALFLANLFGGMGNGQRGGWSSGGSGWGGGGGFGGGGFGGGFGGGGSFGGGGAGGSW